MIDAFTAVEFRLDETIKTAAGETRVALVLCRDRDGGRFALALPVDLGRRWRDAERQSPARDLTRRRMGRRLLADLDRFFATESVPARPGWPDDWASSTTGSVRT